MATGEHQALKELDAALRQATLDYQLQVNEARQLYQQRIADAQADFLRRMLLTTAAEPDSG